MTNKKAFETKAIRDQLERTPFREHSVPMFLTSSFVFPSAEMMQEAFTGENPTNIYSRYSNPNTSEFIDKVCQLEGAESGFATASGMSAVFASLASFLKAGDHLLVSRAVFGSTHQILTKILSRWGITFTYIDPADPSQWHAAVQSNSKMLLVETPSNPGLALVDLQLAGVFAKKHKLIFNVDNCFATPYIQTPIQYGADLVVHSATKWMDGQGRTLGGVIVGKAELIDQIQQFCRHTGPTLSPFNAWVLSKSLETLHVRLERHCSNALSLAQFLENHKIVNRVIYPFLPSHPQFELAKRQMNLGGGLVSFEINGTQKHVFSFLNAIKMCSLTSNLGDTRTTLTHPTSTTHSKLTEEERVAVGISPNLVRISVGLEHVEDIKLDLDQALKQINS